MKKVKYNAYTLLLVCLIMFTGLMVSCNDKDKSSGDVELLSFGPCPIPRGADLRIIGLNLDKVESVTIPGADAINEITRISNTEIRVKVPQTAVSGKIVLKAGKKIITSLANFGIDDKGMTFKDFSPKTAKAGDVIKIEGSYLDFVKGVIFTGEVYVPSDEFVSQGREAIEVIVPLTAKSGVLIISNAAENATLPLWVYSEEELDVVLPTISSFSPVPIRAGAELTITGKDFELVEMITFGGKKEVASFVVNEAKTSIKVTVPVDAKDGNVIFTTFSDVLVVSKEALELVVPTITSISPNPVKAGEILTVTGLDLDLISKVTFGGNRDAVIQEKTATQMKVEVPESAKDGKVIFTTLADKKVESVELKIIPKGGIIVTTIWEGSKQIGWGNPVSLKRSDFVDVPAGAVMTIYFEQVAGNTWPQAQLCQAVTGWPQVKFAELNNNGTIDRNFFGNNGTSIELVLTREILDLLLATNDNGNCMHIQGDGMIFKKIIITSISGPTTDPVKDPALVIFDFDTKGADLWDKIGQIVEGGGPSGKYYEITDAAPVNGTWKWLFADNWRPRPTITDKSKYVLKIDICLKKDIAAPTGSWGVQIQFNMADKVAGGGGGTLNIHPLLQEGGVLTTGGKWITLTFPLETISFLGDPTPTGGDWGLISNQGSPIHNYVGLCVDNIRYELK